MFDAFDKFTANVLMPGCGLLMSLFAGWVVDKKLLYKAFSNNGRETAWFYNWFMLLVRYVAPISIFLIFLSGLGILS